jgi:hypothetical protein
MSNSYSLEDLVTDLDTLFAPIEIKAKGEKFILRNLLRLDKQDRIAVKAAFEKVQGNELANSDDEAEVEGVYEILSIITADGKGPKLVAAIGDDLGLAMKLVELWTEATQPGEAESSPA